MFRDVSPEMAGMVGKWCSTLLYGITVVAYSVCMYVLIKRRGDRNPSATWILISTSTVQFILATIYVALGLRLLIEGFIHTEGLPNTAVIFWINAATKTQMIERAVYLTNIFMADCILIWRMYMVWGKNIYVCVLPVILTCASIGTGYMGIRKLSQITDDSTPKSLLEILNWAIATWSLSMPTQVMSTAMIAGKIWWHAKRSDVSKSHYMSIIVIVVESGAMLTLSTTLLLVCVVLQKQTSGILGDVAAQIAAIVPALIIIRVELIRSNILGPQAQTGSELVFVNRSTAHEFGHRQAESSVHSTVLTLANSDSRRELKYSG